MRPEIAPIALAAALAAGPAGAQELQLFTLGAGPMGGSYYASARAICEVIHQQHEGRLRCSPDPSPGSVYNAGALARGELDFALVQSDIHRAVVEGTGPFAAAGPADGLHSVLALFHEPLTIVVRAGDAALRLADLEGMRLNIGPRNSGTRATAERVFAALGLDIEDFARTSGLPSASALEEFCAGRLDAVMLVVGHPNPDVARALSACGGRLLPLEEAALSAFVAANPDYTLTAIPAGSYPSVAEPVPTISVTATLMVGSGVPDEIVAVLTEAIAGNLALINRRAPMVPAGGLPGPTSDGLTAPVHAAAAAVLAR